jgi:hypothetical protein
MGTDPPLFFVLFLVQEKEQDIFACFLIKKPKIKSRGMCPALLFRTVRGVNRRVLGDKSVGLYRPLY